MTDRRPKPCHYDPATKTRLLEDGEPCTADHCVDCTRTHTAPGQLVCPDCVGAVRTDLEDIRFHARHLRWHAARGNGLTVPSARIPGGDALVAMARAGAGYDDLHTRFSTPKNGTREDLLAEDHPDDDVVPVLLPLLGWEHQWRTYFDHTPRATKRSPVTAITHYLGDHLTAMAQATDGPDWPAFSFDMQALRRQLEGILHDEQEPQRGVPCFECGERLVRRWGKPQPCRHATPGQVALGRIKAGIRAAQAHLATVRSYPELGEPTYAELRAARRTPTEAEEAAARVPCDACSTSKAGQGGIEDPSVGQSWECLGCRKQYDPGEYANAVRRHLLTAGPSGDGWTHIAMAAEAATTMTQVPIAPSTVRRWMDRGQVLSVCRWAVSIDGAREVPEAPGPGRGGRPGHGALVEAFAGRVHGSPGLRLVFWPSVSERAAELVARAEAAAAERVREQQQRAAWRSAVEAGEDGAAAGRRLGIHPARVARFADEMTAEQQVSA
ncbi:hypothetical protein QWY28_13315 [Nocardioides sp. SOB77]|uniref:Helix-turn-helix domain-containing protein n=1 Tax=Nocardioides oceani TaxID=3058369 RepID=A0ABT8FHC0_9ACTN|nr:hypothetical protein [Nocardioides oceani]MDN4173934.1 hypothetical protein [Nocardioides oceani]